MSFWNNLTGIVRSTIGKAGIPVITTVPKLSDNIKFFSLDEARVLLNY
jgi:hypothetical protein